VAINYRALTNATSGANRNIAIGTGAMQNVGAATGGIVIGSYAANSASGAMDKCLIMGDSAAASLATSVLSSKLWLENSAGTTPMLSGNFTTNRVGVNVPYANAQTTLDVHSLLPNTSAILQLESSTDSVKMFVTSASPNSLLTGRIGDLALGTNGGFYFKKTGNNTNTGWEAIVSTSGTSTSISTMMREESFTATAAQTAFTIAYSAPAVSGTSVPIRVYRNGVRLFYVASGPTITQFTYSGTTVTTAANALSDIITIEYLN